MHFRNEDEFGDCVFFQFAAHFLENCLAKVSVGFVATAAAAPLLFGFAWRARWDNSLKAALKSAFNIPDRYSKTHTHTHNGIRFQISQTEHFHCAKWVSAAKLKTLSVQGNGHGAGGRYKKKGVSTCVQGCDHQVWVCVCRHAVCVWKNLKLFHEVKAK